MSKLKWDAPGERLYETGVQKAVLYPQSDDGSYPKGVAWNGITGVSESPSGAEATALYADDVKYLNLRSAEDFGATVTAYTYPDEFAVCDGSAEFVPGVYLGQQARQAFGLCYRTTVGNDIKNNDYGYKIHIIYGATASPSEKSYSTINDSPEAIEFSWEIEATPVEVEGFKPTASITIDCTKFTDEKGKAFIAALEEALYGTESEEAYLPLPAKIKELKEAAEA